MFVIVGVLVVIILVNVLGECVRMGMFSMAVLGTVISVMRNA